MEKRIKKRKKASSRFDVIRVHTAIKRYARSVPCWGHSKVFCRGELGVGWSTNEVVTCWRARFITVSVDRSVDKMYLRYFFLFSKVFSTASAMCFFRCGFPLLHTAVWFLFFTRFWTGLTVRSVCPYAAIVYFFLFQLTKKTAVIIVILVKKKNKCQVKPVKTV